MKYNSILLFPTLLYRSTTPYFLSLNHLEMYHFQQYIILKYYYFHNISCWKQMSKLLIHLCNREIKINKIMPNYSKYIILTQQQLAKASS